MLGLCGRLKVSLQASGAAPSATELRGSCIDDLLAQTDARDAPRELDSVTLCTGALYMLSTMPLRRFFNFCGVFHQTHAMHRPGESKIQKDGEEGWARTRALPGHHCVARWSTCQ